MTVRCYCEVAFDNVVPATRFLPGAPKETTLSDALDVSTNRATSNGMERNASRL
jgi:hypothetical protein